MGCSSDSEAANRAAVALAADWRSAGLSRPDQALCCYAEKLSRTPQDMREDDIVSLRSVGLDDRAIHDAAQVIGYFNYINRVADGLGIDPETWLELPGLPEK